MLAKLHHLDYITNMAFVESVKCQFFPKMAVCDLGQYFPLEISAPHINLLHRIALP